MFDWFDLMRQAQKSAGTDMLARQFQLNPDQAQRAIAAFLPAFAMGMQHAMMAKPDISTVQNLWGGAYQNLWLDAARAFSPDSDQNGHRILDQIFGSDEVSRRVAHQAAAVAGVNSDVMQRMMPVLAGIYAGGLYHWISGQAKAATRSSATAADTPDINEMWGRLLGTWTGVEPAGQKPDKTPFDTMMASFLPPASKPDPAPPAWEDLLEKGRDMQKQYLASLQAIFDKAQKGVAPKG